jgi:hypothetical protein
MTVILMTDILISVNLCGFLLQFKTKDTNMSQLL